MAKYEAIIDGGKDSIDPIRKIIIDNGAYQYEYFPEDIKIIEIKELVEGKK